MGNTGIPVADSFQYLAKLIEAWSAAIHGVAKSRT